MGNWILRYWIESLFAAVTVIVTIEYKKVVSKLKAEEQSHVALKLGVQALLRDRIYQAHNYYCEKGYCPIYARENIEELFKQYKVLGGNGVVCKLVEDMFTLPTSKRVE